MADSSLVTYEYRAPAHGGGQNPNIVTLHSVECPLVPGFARTLIGPAYFGGASAGVSIHYLVDPVDTAQGLPESVVAYHIGGGNAGTIGIEQAGYARFARADWDTLNGLAMLRRVALLLADINLRRPLIQLRFLTDAQLRYAWNNKGTPGGITFHDQCRRVLGNTSHYDPWNAPDDTGQFYPMDDVLTLAIAFRNGGTIPPPTIPGALDMVSDAQYTSDISAIKQAIAEVTRIATESRDRLRGGDTDKGQKHETYDMLQGIDKATADTQYRVRGADTDAGDKHETYDMLQGIDKQTTTAPVVPPEPVVVKTIYTVQTGDTWTSICNKLGVTSAALRESNAQVTDVNSVNVGQVLTIPKN